MQLRDFVNKIHTSTKRDYLARVTQRPKAEVATIAKRFDYDYWDGSRETGYGGMRYDGRWRAVADDMAATYNLQAGQKVLDVGCGKGFLMHDLAEAVPGLEVSGHDLSQYAIDNAKEEVCGKISQGCASKLPYPDNYFDLVISINTLHNLQAPELFCALQEIERVGKSHKYVCVESYRNEEEKVNLMYWQLTCEAFNTPDEWLWWFKQTGYTGDYSFIFFE